MNDLRTILGDGILPDRTLTSLYEIEDVLLLISEINNKIDYYKGLKRHRIYSIDSKISDLSDKLSALRNIVLNTMQKIAPNDKTLNFPSIGKVSRRKAKETVNIDDQEIVIKFLENQGEKDQVVKTVETIDKRKLNTLVAHHYKVGESVPGISIVKGNESLSIVFEKNNQTQESKNINISDTLDALMV